MSEFETRDMSYGDDHEPLDQHPFQTPDQIGPYKILNKLGEGGFGIVYEAQQEHPVKRRVALKVIKPGMDSKKVIARFQAERQALALMSHPNIAKVLDGGITERGLPFFVMEMVHGMPITEYCDLQQLSIDDRLRLLIPVCQAIQHAHTKSVLHRDLKPSNILVAKDSQGHPHPTVIDFGVAKALNDQLTDSTLHTTEGQMVGTPEYMSPEQAGNSGLDIDTRTDVYSLGVVLYELLTGLLPFEPEELRTKVYVDIQRYICEKNPPKPSTRFLSELNQSEKTASASTSAKNRLINVRELPKQLKGELDWVVMKCLEKDRDRRYPTPIALAEELQHYLDDEPVSARPPSTWYQIRKYSKRNKAFVASGAAILAVLILGLAGTTFGFMQANAQRAKTLRANQVLRDQNQNAKKAIEELLVVSGVFDQYDLQPNESTSVFIESPNGGPTQYFTLQALDDGSLTIKPRVHAGEDEQQASDEFAAVLPSIAVDFTKSALQAEQNAKSEAEQRALEAESERAVAQSINTFINDQLLGAVVPEREGRNVLVRDILITAANQLDENPPTVPKVEAALRKTIGHTFRSLGYYDESERHLRRSLELWQDIQGSQTLLTATILEDLAFTLMHTEKYDEAYQNTLRVLDIRNATLGENHPLTIRTLADASMFDALRNGEIVARFDNMTLDMLRLARKQGESRDEILQVVNQIVLDTESFVATGQTEQALNLLRETAEPYLASPLIRDRVPYAVGSYSIMLTQDGTLRSAEALALYAIESGKQYLKPDHPHTLHAMYALYHTLNKQGRSEEALNAIMSCLDGRRRAQGDDHEETIYAISLVAQLLHKLQRTEESMPYYEEAIMRNRSTKGDLAYNTLYMLGEYAAALNDLKRYNDAEIAYKASIEGFAQSDDDPHNNDLILMANLCWMYLNQQRYEDAESLALQCYESSLLLDPRDEGVTALALRLLVDLYQSWDQSEPNAGYDTKATQYQDILNTI